MANCTQGRFETLLLLLLHFLHRYSFLENIVDPNSICSQVGRADTLLWTKNKPRVLVKRPLINLVQVLICQKVMPPLIHICSTTPQAITTQINHLTIKTSTLLTIQPYLPSTTSYLEEWFCNLTISMHGGANFSLELN